ncbi:four helix bundle protein [Bacteroidota bacterium]
MVVKSFKDLIVWQKSHNLTIEIYEITKKFPSEEKFGIISQLRRAAYSVPSNIVEGHSRNSRKEFKHFLAIAKASLMELQYFIILSRDLKYINAAEFNSIDELITEVSKILYSFTKSLQ